MNMGEYCDLGEAPKQLNHINREDKITYPSLNVDSEKFPFLNEMKLGETGEAVIKFRINSKYGGVEVLAIKGLKSEPKKEPKKPSEKPYDERPGNDENPLEMFSQGG